MAQNITLLGASYSDVPAVLLPKTGGGSARFDDVSGDTVVASVMLNGYTAHKADGSAISGSIGNGTITNNTSGGTSSGTVNRGSQIKIGKGYYANDAYYTAQANSGTKNITASGVTSCDGYANVSVAKQAIVLSVTATSNTSVTINNSNITTDYYVYNTASTSLPADLSWSTSTGSVTLTCSGGIPAMTLFLCNNG